LVILGKVFKKQILIDGGNNFLRLGQSGKSLASLNAYWHVPLISQPFFIM